jgi:hypothetical protein
MAHCFRSTRTFHSVLCFDFGHLWIYFNFRVQQLRLVCWKIKPWKQPNFGFGGGQKLFCTTYASPWGVDCDEVVSNLFIGDKAAATNVAFLKRYGITHVLNTAEGQDEGLVDLNTEHYEGKNHIMPVSPVRHGFH